MSHSSDKRTTRQRGLKWLVAAVVVMTTAAVSLSAVAQHGPGRGGPGGPGGFGGPGLFEGPPEHAARAVDHMLKGIDATDAQKTQITQIVQQAAADLKAQHAADRSLREKGTQIFAAPTIDATQAETVRQQLETQHDMGSRRVLQAMLAVGNVLTPNQRAMIATRIAERQAKMQAHMARHAASAP
jgi:protein CpxP